MGLPSATAEGSSKGVSVTFALRPAGRSTSSHSGSPTARASDPRGRRCPRPPRDLLLDGGPVPGREGRIVRHPQAPLLPFPVHDALALALPAQIPPHAPPSHSAGWSQASARTMFMPMQIGSATDVGRSAPASGHTGLLLVPRIPSHGDLAPASVPSPPTTAPCSAPGPARYTRMPPAAQKSSL